MPRRRNPATQLPASVWQIRGQDSDMNVIFATDCILINIKGRNGECNNEYF